MVMNNFENKNFIQPMGRLNIFLHCLICFLLSFGWEVRGGFFHFSFVGGRRKVTFFWEA
jgi:hypothetical protein